jgi:hypothetical protein
MDRASLRSPVIRPLQAQGLRLIATPWPLRHRERFTQEQFQNPLDRQAVTCPAGVTVRLILQPHLQK